jgi:hypothetical protein
VVILALSPDKMDAFSSHFGMGVQIFLIIPLSIVST